MNIGNAIKKVRLHRKWTQLILGSKVGVNRTSISSIESNSKNPSWTLFLSICKEMEIEPAEMMLLAQGETNGEMRINLSRINKIAGLDSHAKVVR